MKKKDFKLAALSFFMGVVCMAVAMFSLMPPRRVSYDVYLPPGQVLKTDSLDSVYRNARPVMLDADGYGETGFHVDSSCHFCDTIFVGDSRSFIH